LVEDRFLEILLSSNALNKPIKYIFELFFPLILCGPNAKHQQQAARLVVAILTK